jgi:mRNA interferase MazF
VPFPFVEAPKLRERPALVIGVQTPSPGIGLLWVLMITSAANKGWAGDVSLETRFAECGLGVSCVVRTAKIATVEARSWRKTGNLPADLMALVRNQVEQALLHKEPK